MQGKCGVKARLSADLTNQPPKMMPISRNGKWLILFCLVCLLSFCLSPHKKSSEQLLFVCLFPFFHCWQEQCRYLLCNEKTKRRLEMFIRKGRLYDQKYLDTNCDCTCMWWLKPLTMGQMMLLIASNLLVSGFPLDFGTWLQGSAPIQPHVHKWGRRVMMGDLSAPHGWCFSCLIGLACVVPDLWIAAHIPD